MRAGSFDRIIVIERQFPTGTTDSLGQAITEWRPVHKAWAAKLHKSEDEAFAASQRYAQRTVTFRTYWLNDVTETDRLECDGVYVDIKGVREIGFREGIEIAGEWQD
jgi:SPP1 family predicted phage head-tail adaptor